MYAKLRVSPIWPVFMEAVNTAIEKPLRRIHVQQNHFVSSDTVAFLNEVGIPEWICRTKVMSPENFLEERELSCIPEDHGEKFKRIFGIIGEMDPLWVGMQSGEKDKIFLFLDPGFDYFCSSIPFMVVIGVVEIYVITLLEAYKKSKRPDTIEKVRTIFHILYETAKEFDPIAFINPSNQILMSMEMLSVSLDEATEENPPEPS